MTPSSPYPVLTPQEAVAIINDGDTVSFSGFGAAGSVKAVPCALAERAEASHTQGRPFRVRVLTGASSGYSIDERLARAEAIAWRAPYQSGKTLRRQINDQQVEYVDMHLSHVPQTMAFGFFGTVDLAVVEATEVTADGRVYLTTSIGASPSCLQHARKVIIEINRRQSPRLREMADIMIPPLPPHRSPIHIYDPLNRIGWSYAVVDPRKVVGIVENDEFDDVENFVSSDGIGHQIARHVTEFFTAEIQSGRIPNEFLPLQSGVGNVANAVMAGLGGCPEIPPFFMYSEVFQDALVDLMLQGKLKGASATALTITNGCMKRILDDFDFFAERIVLRPQEISNHPGIIRRLGVIAMNTAIEADIYGNVNSSHIFGTDIMNGIRRQRGVCPKQLPVHLHDPVRGQGGPHLRHRAHVPPHRQQRTLRPGGGHRTGLGRSARPRPGAARPAAHRCLRPSGLPRLPARVHGHGAARAYPPRFEPQLRTAPKPDRNRKHAAGGLCPSGLAERIGAAIPFAGIQTTAPRRKSPMSHHAPSMPDTDKAWTWKNQPGYKPVPMLIAFVLFAAIVWLPPTRGMLDLVVQSKPAGYALSAGCQNIVDSVNKKLRPEAFKTSQNNEAPDAGAEPLLTADQVARLAKTTVAILFLAAFLWGTESLPLGATDILVGVLLYLFAILPMNEISKAYMKDAVFFIFGILAVAVGVAKTGLDKRIGLILLSRIKSARGFAFLFLPLLAVTASFLSEHALVALLLPVLMGGLQGHLPRLRREKGPGPGGLSASGGLLCRQPRRPRLPGGRRPQRHHGGGI